MRKASLFFALLLTFCLLLPAVPAASAQAQDITQSCTVTATGFLNTDFLTDQVQTEYVTSQGHTTITLKSPDGIGSLYLLFDTPNTGYTVTDNTTARRFTAGKDGFLHEFLDLTEEFGEAPTSVTLNFGYSTVQISEIYAFSTGDTPAFVQKWSAPLEGNADIVLFSAHFDDDQLYFAGLLPLYAGVKGYNVQVVYMTDHRTGLYPQYERMHEVLNGLWTNGVTAYPVFGAFADFRIDSLQDTYEEYRVKYMTTEEELLSWVVEQVRRFKPMVAVSHDIGGEYGHGMHRVYTDLLIKSLPITADADQFPASAQKYGTWELPKLYLHLYGQNTLILDIDTPQDALNGLSPFQVAQQLGFPSHESQQIHSGFTNWLYGKEEKITQASQIEKYNPAYYGLYHTTVGLDSGANDLMEHVLTHEQVAQEEAQRLEQERLESERLEQERLEQQRLEQQHLAAEQKRQERKILYISISAVAFCLLALAVLLIILKRKKKSP